MKAALALLALSVVALAQEDAKCPTVSPIRNFQYPGFEGQWFEIGHYRNAGPMIWAENNFCSTINVTRDELGEADGDSLLTYNANLDEPNGFLQYFDTRLLEMRPPGQWKQEVIPNPVFFSLHQYTVLELTDTYALTYRCGTYDDEEGEGSELSYTVQLLSRSNQLSVAVEEKLKKVVAGLKVNVENVEYRRIPHTNCTYMDH